MAWSWSHTNEAYQYAREQVAAQERDWLETVYAEWKASHGDDNLNEEAYKEHLEKAKQLPDDILADFIWEKMEEQATCTNGGWEAWCCPFGCGCHMVPFSEEEE